MVTARTEDMRLAVVLSVLALSSRFDGRSSAAETSRGQQLSVLALSSRFDGLKFADNQARQIALSVLALSSRFDGQGRARAFGSLVHFQYSLCRVVLMVQTPSNNVFFGTSTFSTRSVESF